jgi:hypothetical protein
MQALVLNNTEPEGDHSAAVFLGALSDMQDLRVLVLWGGLCCSGFTSARFCDHSAAVFLGVCTGALSDMQDLRVCVLWGGLCCSGFKSDTAPAGPRARLSALHRSCGLMLLAVTSFCAAV